MMRWICVGLVIASELVVGLSAKGDGGAMSTSQPSQRDPRAQAVSEPLPDARCEQLEVSTIPRGPWYAVLEADGSGVLGYGDGAISAMFPKGTLDLQASLRTLLPHLKRTPTPATQPIYTVTLRYETGARVHLHTADSASVAEVFEAMRRAYDEGRMIARVSSDRIPGLWDESPPTPVSKRFGR